MTRIKICGLTRAEDALLAVELGAHYLGLNFSEYSPRRVGIGRAREIVTAVEGRASIVGVFVNARPREIEQIDTQVGLDLVQFHGDEEPVAVNRLGARAIRAMRVDEQFSSDQLESYPDVWGFFFDRAHDTLYGGTGERWDYSRIARVSRKKPFFVAGGLRPDTVRRAIKESEAWGVDVCSGIETRPGIKDPVLMRNFIQETRSVQVED